MKKLMVVIVFASAALSTGSQVVSEQIVGFQNMDLKQGVNQVPLMSNPMGEQRKVSDLLSQLPNGDRIYLGSDGGRDVWATVVDEGEGKHALIDGTGEVADDYAVGEEVIVHHESDETASFVTAGVAAGESRLDYNGSSWIDELRLKPKDAASLNGRKFDLVMRDGSVRKIRVEGRRMMTSDGEGGIPVASIAKVEAADGKKDEGVSVEKAIVAAASQNDFKRTLIDMVTSNALNVERPRWSLFIWFLSLGVLCFVNWIWGCIGGFLGFCLKLAFRSMWLALRKPPALPMQRRRVSKRRKHRR